MWLLETLFSGEHGGAKLIIAFSDLGGLFQP